MPTVKFQVQSDLESYFSKVKSQGNELANTMLVNAQKEGAAAKQTIKLIEDQIKLIETKNRLTGQIGSIGTIVNRNERIDNIDSRNTLLDSIRKETQSKFRNKEITLDEFQGKMGRIEKLYSANSPEAITSQSKEFARKQQDAFKEQQLQTKLLRDNVQSVREGASANVQAVKNGDKSIEDVIKEAKTPQEKLAAQLAQEELEGKKPKSNNDLMKLITGTLGVGAITSIVSEFGKLTQTKNGFDLIGAAEETKGKIIGGAIGTAVGAAIGLLFGGVGAFAGASAGLAAGSSIGGGIGGVEGGVKQRIIDAQMAYIELQNRFTATTGGGIGMKDMSMYGLSMADQLSSSREYARLSGSSKNARSLSEQSYFAEQGYGVDRGTSNSLIDIQRSTNSDDIRLAGIISGVLEKGKNSFFKGGDQTFLNEFLGKYATLTKELLKSANTVASGTAFDILSKFDSVGGQFSSKDPRSMGLISTINSSLANPGNDFAQAGDFIALRQAYPEMDFIDLLKEQQKALGSPKYLSAVLKQIKATGVGRREIYNIAGRFGLKNNIAAAESIYNHQDDLISGKTSLENIDGLGDLSGKAKELTTQKQINEASLSNKFITTITTDWASAVSQMKDEFIKAMDSVSNGMRIVKNADGSTSLQFSADLSRKNVSLREQQQIKENYRSSGLNPNGSYNPSSVANKF